MVCMELLYEDWSKCGIRCMNLINPIAIKEGDQFWSLPNVHSTEHVQLLQYVLSFNWQGRILFHCYCSSGAESRILLILAHKVTWNHINSGAPEWHRKGDYYSHRYILNWLGMKVRVQNLCFALKDLIAQCHMQSPAICVYQALTGWYGPLWSSSFLFMKSCRSYESSPNCNDIVSLSPWIK